MKNSLWISFVAALLIGAVLYANFDEAEFITQMYQSGLFGEKAEITEQEFQESFMDFVATYQRSYYNSYEFENRYSVFKDNYQKISDHNLNADFSGFTMKINQFGDLTLDEFASKHLGFNADLKKHHKQHKQHKPRHHKKPSFESFFDNEVNDEHFENFSWVKEGRVHAVKNQGSCGSCWAFSAIGSTESAIAIASNSSAPSLSEQQLVDCDTKQDHDGQGNAGCNGGLMDWAFDFEETHTMCTETEYPYKGQDKKCADSACANKTFSIVDFTDVEVGSKSAMKLAVTQQPVSIAVDAANLAWQFYFGGVVRHLCGTSLDHGVLNVGYGYEESKLWGNTDFWVVKNSWGSSWGESGYIRIKADDTKTGTCGLLLSGSYPTVEMTK
jgi:C1A family cysteine protease